MQIACSVEHCFPKKKKQNKKKQKKKTKNKKKTEKSFYAYAQNTSYQSMAYLESCWEHFTNYWWWNSFVSVRTAYNLFDLVISRSVLFGFFKLPSGRNGSVNSKQRTFLHIRLPVFTPSIWRRLCKQCRPRSDATFCGIWSGSALFAIHSTVFGHI